MQVPRFLNVCSSEITAPEKTLRDWCFLVNIFGSIIPYRLGGLWTLFFLRVQWNKRFFVGVFITLSNIRDGDFCENS